MPMSEGLVKDLLKFSNLQSLDIVSPIPQAKIVSLVTQLSSIRIVPNAADAFGPGTDDTEPVSYDIRDLQHLPNLQSLELHNFSVMGAASLQALSRLTQLKLLSSDVFRRGRYHAVDEVCSAALQRLDICCIRSQVPDRLQPDPAFFSERMLAWGFVPSMLQGVS